MAGSDRQVYMSSTKCQRSLCASELGKSAVVQLLLRICATDISVHDTV